ncbi:MAG: YdeI/OmpD-associated family protein [Candidatus Saccharimonadales bacterium]
MSKEEIADGTVHKMPADLRKALTSASAARVAWQSLTPLARNEWICWTVTVKQQKTRDEHVKRVVSELKEGMRRPCCWVGCIHRTDKPISPSVQWALDKRSKAN